MCGVHPKTPNALRSGFYISKPSKTQNPQANGLRVLLQTI
jgi:hypothetical protein